MGNQVASVWSPSSPTPFGLAGLKTLHADKSSFFHLLPTELLLLNPYIQRILPWTDRDVCGSAVERFNRNARDCIRWLNTEKHIDDSPASLALFLYTAPGLEKRRVGEVLLWKPNAREPYLAQMNFTGMQLDEAYRLLIERLNAHAIPSILSGEFTSVFVRCYCDCNRSSNLCSPPLTFDNANRLLGRMTNLSQVAHDGLSICPIKEDWIQEQQQMMPEIAASYFGAIYDRVIRMPTFFETPELDFFCYGKDMK